MLLFVFLLMFIAIKIIAIERGYTFLKTYRPKVQTVAFEQRRNRIYTRYKWTLAHAVHKICKHENEMWERVWEWVEAILADQLIEKTIRR